MAPKRTVQSEGEQKQDPKTVKKLRRSDRLKNAVVAAAAAPKEDPKPQKRARKSSPKLKKKQQLKEKVTKEETAPAENGETKPDKEQKTESANDQND